MNATPPEARGDGSRGSRGLWGGGGGAGGGGGGGGGAGRASTFLLAGGLLGAALLVVAEFSPLYQETSAASRAALHTVRSGSHHGYALIPIGLLAGALAVAAARSASRAALLALLALGLAAALVAVLGDLPDATASGLVGSTAGGYTRAKNVPEAGMYFETLGAALLVVIGATGLALTTARRTVRHLT